MANALTWITFILCIITFVRMFTYKRDGSHFHRGVSVAATLLMFASAAGAVSIGLGDFKVQPAAWPMIVMHAILVVGLIHTKGNLSPIIRGSF